MSLSSADILLILLLSSAVRWDIQEPTPNVPFKYGPFDLLKCYLKTATVSENCLLNRASRDSYLKIPGSGGLTLSTSIQPTLNSPENPSGRSIGRGSSMQRVCDWAFQIPSIVVWPS
jgi:hypothetical protein